MATARQQACPRGIVLKDLCIRSNAARRIWDIGDRIYYTGPLGFDYQTGEPLARVGAPRGIPGRKVYRPGMADDGATITGVQARLQARPHQSYNYGGAQLPMRVY